MCVVLSFWSYWRSWGQGGWKCAVVTLQVSKSAWIQLLPTLSRCRENINNGAPWFLWSWKVPSDPRELLQFPNLLYVDPLSRLLCRSCSISPQLSLRRKCSKCGCIFGVFLGGGKYQRPPVVPSWTHLRVVVYSLFLCVGGNKHCNFLLHHLADDLLLHCWDIIL